MKKFIYALILIVSVSCVSVVNNSAYCSCPQIKSQGDCSQNSGCVWSNSACIAKLTSSVTYCSTLALTSCNTTIGCALVNGACTFFTGCTAYLQVTDASCKLISNQCTSDGTRCIAVAMACSQYLTNIGCLIDSYGNYCYWDSSNMKCGLADTCSKLPVTLTTDAQCRAANITCTTNGAGCVTSASTCSGQSQLGCVTALSQSVKCLWSAGACIDKPVASATPSTCSSVTASASCSISQNGLCFWDGTANQCKDWQCAYAPSTYNSDNQCNGFMSTCTVNSSLAGCMIRSTSCNSYTVSQQCVATFNGQLCYWNGSSCTVYSCDNATLQVYTDALCKKYSPQCGLSQGKCAIRTCNILSYNNCSYDYQFNKCNWSSNCVLSQCSNAPSDYYNHQQCQSYQNSCTISSIGSGCIPLLSTCSTYTQSQCYLQLDGTLCTWSNNACAARTCSNAPLTLLSDSSCQLYLSSCTLASSGQGCTLRVSDCSLLTQAQCTTLIDGTPCYWMASASLATPPTPPCVVRQCSQQQLSTDQSCSAFLSSCTVDPTGTFCVSKQSTCNLYTSIGQCVQTSTGTQCVWNPSVNPPACQTRNCTNATQFGSDAQCSKFLSTCTVNSTATACTTRLPNCSSYLLQSQCVMTLTGSQCSWINSACVPTLCSYAPSSYITHAQCQQFMNTCTTTGQGCTTMTTCALSNKLQCVRGTDGQCALNASCQIQSCFDAPLTYNTDTQCSAFLSTCTTNGAGCITRTTCANAIQAACVTNSTGGQCAWVNGYCTNLTCASAPNYLTSELECRLFMTGCTAALSGGCVAKSTCSAAQVQAACTTDIQGNQCVYSSTGCRNMVCTDYQGVTNAVCQAQMSTCTSDGTRCVTQTTCALKQQAGCFYGSDGPCLWVFNQCQQYSSCASIQATADAKCKSISSQCTTNGVSCIAITSCALSLNVSCFTGTDGTCVLTPATIGGTAKCALYSGCSSVYYATHADCQKANIACTTNTLSCIDLTDCGNYKYQAGCVMNSTQQPCTWNPNTQTCRNAMCSDYTYKTDALCSTQLAGCTSDGQTCIVKLPCASYGQTQCLTSTGTTGKCYFDPVKYVCAPATCAVLVNCSLLSGCVDAGNYCVAKGQCSSYTTQQACSQGGTDGNEHIYLGQCTWGIVSGVGTCALMTSCSLANSDSVACYARSNSCSWNQATSNGTLCTNQTCSTQYASTNTCKGIVSFDYSQISLCSLSGASCVSTNTSSLNQNNCYSATGGRYTWDAINTICSVCNATNSTIPTTNSTNTTNTTNTTTPSTSYASILLISYVFIMI